MRKLEEFKIETENLLTTNEMFNISGRQLEMTRTFCVEDTCVNNVSDTACHRVKDNDDGTIISDTTTIT